MRTLILVVSLSGAFGDLVRKLLADIGEHELQIFPDLTAVGRMSPPPAVELWSRWTRKI